MERKFLGNTLIHLQFCSNHAMCSWEIRAVHFLVFLQLSQLPVNQILFWLWITSCPDVASNASAPQLGQTLRRSCERCKQTFRSKHLITTLTTTICSNNAAKRLQLLFIKSVTYLIFPVGGTLYSLIFTFMGFMIQAVQWKRFTIFLWYHVLLPSGSKIIFFFLFSFPFFLSCVLFIYI